MRPINPLPICPAANPAGRRPQQPNIGYPKLFTVGAVDRRGFPAGPSVNNFAPRVRPGISDDHGLSSVLSLNSFPAPAGQVCERPVALTTLQFNDRPVGRWFWLSTTHREGVSISGRLFYIVVARSSLRDCPNHNNHISRPAHESPAAA
jgi:hypothetical protein